jgi:2-polyprenyl-3-methyl-5-hydroxy-6-metoxy-1,4-benzoquinol methylase
MFAPNTVHDPQAWDEHWQQQLNHGFTLAFIDMFCRDEEFVRALQQLGAQRMLCVGSGLSLEPHAFAAAGLHVTALDLSPLAMRVAATAQVSAEQLQHFFPPELARSGGTVNFVAGDLTDPALCPGPYDVIVERLTMQLFPDDERAQALDALVARLSPAGVLFTHCHGGSGGPNTRPHALEGLLTSRGWPFWQGRGQPKPTGQVAWLFYSTG